MLNLVAELQKACFDPNIKCKDLLRMASLVAQKLDVKDMIDFCKNEIEGYPNAKCVPEFRSVYVVYKIFNPRNGWIPVAMPAEMSAKRCLKPVELSISELESFVNGSNGTMEITLCAEEQVNILELAHCPVPMRVSTFFSKTQIVKIVEIVKNRITDWAVALGNQGIMGNEFDFTQDEKIKAQSMSITNITVNGSVRGSNILGSVEKSSVVVNNDQFDFGAVEKFVDSISQMLQHSDVPKETQGALLLQVTDIKQKISEKDSIGVKKILGTMGDIVKNITGSVLASGIWNQIQSFLN